MTPFRYLLLFAMLSGSILFLNRKFKIRQHLSPLIACLGNTIVLYFCSLLNILKPGLYGLIAVNILLGILAFVRLKKVKDVQTFSFSPSLVAYFLVFVFLISFTRGMQVWEWDEYSYWGSIYRYLIAVNQLPNLSSNFLFLNYPPFTAIFQYFVSFFIGPQESSAYFAHILLNYTVIISIFPEPLWKNWKKYVFYFCIAVMSCIAIDFKFQSLYVDLLLGLLFGSSIVQIFLDKEIQNDSFIALLLSSISLVVIKPFGIIFSVIIWILYLFKILFVKIQGFQKPFIKCILKAIILDSKLVNLLLLPFIVYLSWSTHIAPFQIDSIHLTFNETANSNEQSISIYEDELQQKYEKFLLENTHNIQISTTKFLNILSSVSDSRTKDILNNYIIKFHSSRYYRFPLTILQITLAILIVTFLLSKLSKIGQTENAYTLKKLSIILFVSWCFYNFLLLFTYIFYFYPAEGVSVPSMERYVASFIIGWWILLISYASYHQSIKIPIIQTSSYEFIFFMIFVLFLIKIPLGSLIPISHTPDQHRFAVSKMYKEVINGFDEGGEKVYLVFNRDTTQGYQFTIMKYFMTPIATNNFGWDLGETDQYSNVYKVNMSTTEWMSLLIEKEYTHVLVCNADDAFWEKYRTLFDTYSTQSYPQLFSVENGRLISISTDD